jgi:RNA 2',3'-cyclic 3'-phosphodiesterase
MRLFIGIPLAETARSSLDRLVARMKPKLPGGRWSHPDSWHITLQFLGSTRPEQYDQLIAQLLTIHAPTLSIHLGGLGLFDRNSVLFVDVTVSPALAAVQKRVQAATAPWGFLAESRSYHPHITLARLKGGDRRGLRHLRDSLPEPERFPGFLANEFLLYESFLSPAGARYEIRQRFPLI